MWNLINRKKSQIDPELLGLNRCCPICGSKRSKVILELQDFQFYSDSMEESKQFSVKENVCLDCFALYLNPVYSDYGFKVLFREAGQSYGVLDSHISDQIEWLNQRNLLEHNASLLDVGCYEGEFLSKLPENIKKYGVDIDGPAIERARKKLSNNGTEFYCGAFETFNFKGDPPDTIIMFHVLEHVVNPVGVLNKLKQISKSTTKLVIEVPIIESGKTNDINGFFSIQHATHFSHNSLHNCLNKAGWKIIEECPMENYNGFRVNAILQEDCEPTVKIEQKDWLLRLDYLSDWYNSLKNVEAKIEKIGEFPNYVIWGGGAHSEFLYQTTSLFHIKQHSKFVIVDGDPLKHGTTWRGIEIHSPDILNEINWNETGLIISSYGSQDQIKTVALNLGIQEDKIYQLYNRITRY